MSTHLTIKLIVMCSQTLNYFPVGEMEGEVEGGGKVMGERG